VKPLRERSAAWRLIAEWRDAAVAVDDGRARWDWNCAEINACDELAELLNVCSTSSTARILLRMALSERRAERERRTNG